MPFGLPMTSVKKAHTLTPGRHISWFKNSVKGDEFAYESYSAKGATVSLEAGYGFALNKSFGLEAAKYTSISQPQAQAIWMGVDHNAHTEANGSRIENDANNNIQTRLRLPHLWVWRKTAVRTVTTLNLLLNELDP